MTQLKAPAKINLPLFQFAIVQNFNTNNPRDMQGTLCLEDGTVLPFNYTDWVEGWEEARSDDSRYSPYAMRGHDDFLGGNTMFSWPSPGVVLFVLIEEGAVKFWTWPGLILRNADDHRYLQAPDYTQPVAYPGLHIANDATKLDAEWRRALEEDGMYDPGRQAVYVGHHLDAFIAAQDEPFNFLLMRWDTQEGKARFVGYCRSGS